MTVKTFPTPDLVAGAADYNILVFDADTLTQGQSKSKIIHLPYVVRSLVADVSCTVVSGGTLKLQMLHTSDVHPGSNLASGGGITTTSRFVMNAPFLTQDVKITLTEEVNTGNSAINDIHVRLYYAP